MKEANSSKWMYMRSTADISLKWNDIRNADITKLGDITSFHGKEARQRWKR
uniref:Uncharacterized protein n=2 Tax=Candidatus Methanogaster sp. ANME-2c ERB4 TaxID=2759911 RepID=A0A7G9YBD6_9EURY|nr:hypothetical protein GKHIBCHD_00004 [Methanosarcinales archaeon ANME-2c ERB4]